MLLSRFCLLVVSVMLTIATGGCCGDAQDRDISEDLEGEIVGGELESARMFGTTDEEHCEAACRLFLADPGFDYVTSCEAVGTDEYADKPWDPENTLTTVTCTARLIERVFCT